MKETRLWAELLQSLAAVSLLVGMIVVGANYSGSVDTAITVMAEKLLTEMRSSPLDSFNVYNLLSVIVGGSFTLLGLLSFNPVLMQEFVKITELRKAKIAVYLNSFVGAIFFAITAVCGFIWHTAISDEEVMNTSDYNRLLAAFTIATTRSLVLVRGLFLGFLFMASLRLAKLGKEMMIPPSGSQSYPKLVRARERDSSSVTLANGAAIVFSRDLCEKIGTYHHRPRGLLFVLTELGMIALAAATSYGFIQTHQSFLQLTLLFAGAFGGPLLAVFTAGILFSCINKHGALVGLAVSQIFGVSFICFNFLYDKSRADCSQFDQCQIISVTHSISEVLEIVRPFFGISLLYVAPICCAIGFMVALLISVATTDLPQMPAYRLRARTLFLPLHCRRKPKCGVRPRAWYGELKGCISGLDSFDSSQSFGWSPVEIEKE
ncbi:unnamed protein product [Calicophoron daubneyi]|uniref:Uncharacterized protein n=1 Tax=Calicophoron daubneyi TaxID=300641 RepID=A0AAV2TCS1_CALDB